MVDRAEAAFFKRQSPRNPAVGRSLQRADIREFLATYGKCRAGEAPEIAPPLHMPSITENPEKPGPSVVVSPSLQSSTVLQNSFWKNQRLSPYFRCPAMYAWSVAFPAVRPLTDSEYLLPSGLIRSDATVCLSNCGEDVEQPPAKRIRVRDASTLTTDVEILLENRLGKSSIREWISHLGVTVDDLKEIIQKENSQMLLVLAASACLEYLRTYMATASNEADYQELQRAHPLALNPAEAAGAKVGVLEKARLSVQSRRNRMAFAGNSGPTVKARPIIGARAKDHPPKAIPVPVTPPKLPPVTAKDAEGGAIGFGSLAAFVEAECRGFGLESGRSYEPASDSWLPGSAPGTPVEAFSPSAAPGRQDRLFSSFETCHQRRLRQLCCA